MISFAVVFVYSMAFYLLLTLGSGQFLLWSAEELVLGAVFSVLVSLLAGRVFTVLDARPGKEWLNPKRITLFVLYIIGPLFFEIARANLDVAKRVVTGKVKPGIVKIDPGLKTDFGVMMLANGITLTPGTLAVDVGRKRELFVHWIFVEKNRPGVEDICSGLCDWVRRIAE